MLSQTILKLSGDDRLYYKCFQSLLQSDCVAGVSWLNPRGCPLYERRLDQHLPAGKEGDCLGLVSAAEGRQLAKAVQGLTDEGICREGSLSCVGTSFQAFGGSPLGIFAVGPGRRLGMIVRSLPSVGILVVFYRFRLCGTSQMHSHQLVAERPHMPQEVVPYVEKFMDTLWANVRGLR